VFISIVLYNSTPEVTEPTLVLLFFLLVFYVNMYLLVPKLLFKNNYILYCLSIFGLIAISALIYNIGCTYFGKGIDSDGLNIPLFSALIVVLVAASSSVKLFQKWILDKQLIYELEKSKI